MTCATCGAVGAAEATWCGQCYLPYVRAGASRPPVVGLTSRTAMPWQAPAHPSIPPPAYAPPVFAAPPVHAGNAFAGPAASAPPYPPTGYPSVGYPPSGLGHQHYSPPSWPAKLGLVVPEIAVQTGDLPRICVVSGRPTDNFVKMRWSWAPAWTYVFLFAGVLPVILLRYVLGTRSAGYLPIHRDVRRKRRRQGVLAVLGFLGGLGAFIAAAALSSALPALLGVALIVGGIWTACLPGRALPVRPAGPGFLAFPKASPAFAAAFRAGRPASQVPYSASPVKYRTGKVWLVLAGICVLIMVPAAIFGAVQDHNCRKASAHVDAAVVYSLLNASDDAVAAQATADGNQGMTEVEARRQLAADQRLIATLSSTGLNSRDRVVADQYEAALSSYDSALDAALTGASPGAGSQVTLAAQRLDAAESSLRRQLSSVPSGCSGA
ncbi:MAG: hypothetical protein QOJ11_3171 [Frankiales bacterium]|nr:hypothetical protein [Frankiales bacterium]